MQKFAGKTFYIVERKALRQTMSEGIRPVAAAKPLELRVADLAFDIVAERLGVPHRRNGIIAFPDLISARRCAMSDMVILGIQVDPAHTLVLHRAWLDLAWGIMEGIFSRIRPDLQPMFRAFEPREFLGQMQNIQIHEGMAVPVLSELAENYWKSAVPLAGYGPDAAKRMDTEVLASHTRFRGLMPGLGHEAVLGTDSIPPERLSLGG